MVMKAGVLKLVVLSFKFEARISEERRQRKREAITMVDVFLWKCAQQPLMNNPVILLCHCYYVFSKQTFHFTISSSSQYLPFFQLYIHHLFFLLNHSLFYSLLITPEAELRSAKAPFKTF